LHNQWFASLARELFLTPIADLRLQLLRCGAKRKSAVHVTIGAPQPDGNDWCCPIRLKGLVVSEERRIFGVDSWQAIILSLRLAEAMLKNEVRKGGRLFYLGGETSVAKLFAPRVRG
jgi:hypothetical protein